MLHVVLRSKGAIKNYSFSFSHQNYKEATLKISNECKWRRYFRCMILTIFVRAKYYPLSETLIKKFDSFISRDINTRRYFLNFFPRECFFFFFNRNEESNALCFIYRYHIPSYKDERSGKKRLIEAEMRRETKYWRMNKEKKRKKKKKKN